MLGGKPPGLPMGRFGNLWTLDRDEIESLRAVRNIVRRYINNKKDRKPLSLAVFGPPGSGKSFAVREILSGSVFRAFDFSEGIGDKQRNTRERKIESNRKSREINLSELCSPAELYDRMRYGMNCFKNKGTNIDEIPVFFLDEFDSEVGGYLGWLKNCLGFMQDGFIPAAPCEVDAKVKSLPIEIKRSILVFAGGTKKTYLDFSCEDASISEKERLAFKTAKGPDFVSRLRGHIDIKGVNKIGADDNTFLVRRAILLRSFVTKYMLYDKRAECGEGRQEADIDPSVIFAMLKTGSYKHGARSMEALVSMCMPLHGMVQRSSLPSEPLMNMHVNASEFKSLMDEYEYHSGRMPRGANVYVAT